MDFQDVQQQLTDLPRTFLRQTVPFTQWLDSLTAMLTRDTGALDRLLEQIQSIANARFGWLDTWGLLFGIVRQSNEADQFYRARIIYEVNAGGGPAVAIAKWIKAVWRVDAQITETLGQVGYNVVFQTVITVPQAIQILQSLARVRPAGVPILSIFIPGSVGPGGTGGGLFLDTINFLDLAPDVTGAYLVDVGGGGGGGGATPIGNFGLSAATNSAQPILPDLLLTDPTLNPQ